MLWTMRVQRVIVDMAESLLIPTEGMDLHPFKQRLTLPPDTANPNADRLTSLWQSRKLFAGASRLGVKSAYTLEG